MNSQKRARSVTTDGQPPAPGWEDASAPQPVGTGGQHGAYWVLSEEERARGLVRPVRRSYRHVGPPGPRYPLQVLTSEEVDRFAGQGYVRFEVYPEEHEPLVGRYWRQDQIDRIGDGCGTTTTMATPLAQTWACDISYYGSTFCCGCGTHLPVEEFVWIDESGRVTDERLGS